MTSYIQLLYNDMNDKWNVYVKFESVINILCTSNDLLAPILVERLIELKYVKLQELHSIKAKIEKMYMSPYHYMKYMFPTHEINDIWS